MTGANNGLEGSTTAGPAVACRNFSHDTMAMALGGAVTKS
jgi:hypothetical protein